MAGEKRQSICFQMETSLFELSLSLQGIIIKLVPSHITSDGPSLPLLSSLSIPPLLCVYVCVGGGGGGGGGGGDGGGGGGGLGCGFVHACIPGCGCVCVWCGVVCVVLNTCMCASLHISALEDKHQATFAQVHCLLITNLSLSLHPSSFV